MSPAVDAGADEDDGGAEEQEGRLEDECCCGAGECGDVSPVSELDSAAAALPVRVVFDGIRPRLAPASDGVRGALSWLLIAIIESQAEGTWGRLKLCPADDCLLAFYDASKNRSRSWCSMRECGNRQKTRNYRARQHLREHPLGSDGG